MPTVNTEHDVDGVLPRMWKIFSLSRHPGDARWHLCCLKHCHTGVMVKAQGLTEFGAIKSAARQARAFYPEDGEL